MSQTAITARDVRKAEIYLDCHDKGQNEINTLRTALSALHAKAGVSVKGLLKHVDDLRKYNTELLEELEKYRTVPTDECDQADNGECSRPECRANNYCCIGADGITDEMLNEGQERLCQLSSRTNFDDHIQAEIYKAMRAVDPLFKAVQS